MNIDEYLGEIATIAGATTLVAVLRWVWRKLSIKPDLVEIKHRLDKIDQELARQNRIQVDADKHRARLEERIAFMMRVGNHDD